jgi:PAS domain S-box-containing protein
MADLQKTREGLAAGEAYYRLVYETALHVIMSVDRQGIIVGCNPRVREMPDYATEELIGRPMTLLIHPDDLEHARGCLGALVKAT